MKIDLYKLDEHPTTLELIIRKFEIVKETPKYYFIQVRGVKNKKAEKNTIKIKKDDNLYFASPKDAIRAYIDTQEEEIKQAQIAISHAQNNIKKIKKELNDI